MLAKSNTIKIGIGTLAAAVGVIAISASPAHAYGQNDWRNHPSSQGWRYSQRNHTWYKPSGHQFYHNNSGHRNFGEADDWKYSHRNHTWYYRNDQDDTFDHPASQGWRWSNHDHMWYQTRRR
jgi:hypothetical protein